jgi:cytochrome c-type biogenesis protein CcmF
VGLPRSVYGTALAHAGLGVTLLGIVSVTALQVEHFQVMKPGERAELADFVLTFEGLEPMRGPNYVDERGRFTVLRGGAPAGEIVSAKRVYTARQMPTTEAGIRTFSLGQLYVSLGDATADGGIVVRAWWKPLVTLIWLGSVLMMLGGTLSLLDRRLRVGAPSPRKAAGRPAEAAA